MLAQNHTSVLFRILHKTGQACDKLCSKHGKDITGKDMIVHAVSPNLICQDLQQDFFFAHPWNTP